MVVIEDRTTVAAPIAAVWAATLDVQRIPDITPTVVALTRLDDGPLAVGSRVRIRQPLQPAAVWTVEALDEPTLFAWSTSMAGVRVVASHELAPSGPGATDQVLSVRFEGRGARVMGTIVRPFVAAALRRENAGYRAAVPARSDS